MKIDEMVSEGVILKKILYSPKERNENFNVIVLERVFFEFENNLGLLITVDVDTDELIIKEVSQADAGMVDIALLCPDFQQSYGCGVLWSWEMVNHQGYFDALQMEFYNKTLGQEIIFQLKAVASHIFFYMVKGV